MADVPAVTERVQRVFAQALNVPAPAPDDDVIDSGVLDSLALVELLFALEREFGVTIPVENLEIDSFRTVRSIAGLVEAAGARA